MLALVDNEKTVVCRCEVWAYTDFFRPDDSMTPPILLGHWDRHPPQPIFVFIQSRNNIDITITDLQLI